MKIIVIYEALCFDVAQGRMNGHPMRLKLTRVGLLVKLANRYTTKGAQEMKIISVNFYFTLYILQFCLFVRTLRSFTYPPRSQIGYSYTHPPLNHLEDFFK